MQPRDIVRSTVSTWRAARPDLDLAPMEAVLRLATAVKLVVEASELALAPLGISLGEFDVLATIRRHGADTSLTPSEIAELTMVSPSGLTNRLANLEKAGLVRRTMDPSDRRRYLASLTAEGVALTDRAVGVLAALDAQLVPAVPDRTTATVARYLDDLIDAATAHGTSDPVPGGRSRRR